MTDADRDPSRMLAALPVKLIPGPFPTALEEAPSPLRLSLFVAWGCVVLAAVAVAVLLVGTLTLSERRGAFVSAVTHELRTPLTTFRMYTEMLAEKMISEEKRQRYLDTLRTEAERLSHLVENVLSYARLENRRGLRQMETATLQDLFARVQSRLAERVQQSGRQLVLDAPSDALAATAAMDASAVEQILLNLVDNACKYSASASDPRIHLEATADATNVVLRVRDHGPGISRSDARKLFRPFSKSAREAANSAPGVGLGLALSRRLARSMGGDLRLDDRVKDGASFEVLLRRAE
jgi:signal transduction histidine kinase